MVSILFAVLITLLPVPAAAPPAPADSNVAGEWDLTWGTAGNMNTERLTLEQDGSTLTGKLYSDENTYAPIDGKVNGSNVEFGVSREKARNAFAPWFTGTTDGSTMKGKVKVGPITDRFTFTASRK